MGLKGKKEWLRYYDFTRVKPKIKIASIFLDNIGTRFILHFFLYSFISYSITQISTKECFDTLYNMSFHTIGIECG